MSFVASRAIENVKNNDFNKVVNITISFVINIGNRVLGDCDKLFNQIRGAEDSFEEPIDTVFG